MKTSCAMARELILDVQLEVVESYYREPVAGLIKHQPLGLGRPLADRLEVRGRLHAPPGVFEMKRHPAEALRLAHVLSLRPDTAEGAPQRRQRDGQEG